MTSQSTANTAIRQYRDRVLKELRSEQATEHAYRPALKTLLEELGGHAVLAVNDPKRANHSAPDFIVQHHSVPIGHVECKDIGHNLDQTEQTEQLTRYLDALPNFILTDYLEFRWYAQGQRRQSARIGSLDNNGKIVTDFEGAKQLVTLIESFYNAEIATVSNAKDLAQRMAASARLLRDGITNILDSEENTGRFHGYLDAYRSVLIESLTPADFADMQAQTFAYGLFAARCRHDRTDNNPFTRQAAIFTQTTPFLSDVFAAIAGHSIDPDIAWIVDDLAELLDRSDMSAILADFGSSNAEQDPVVHFYEDFLRAYDPELREMRGVYYTPEPVVSYIVRSIDALLRETFNLNDGLADNQTTVIEQPDGSTVDAPKVLILDPAAGTGTFLREVISCVRNTITKKMAGAWPSYVRDHLLPRLFGFELLMAPYAICHLKLGLEITGNSNQPALPPGQRLNVFLTNTLEGPHQPTDGQKLLMLNAVAEESASADVVKRDHHVMVILGNPPYSGHSANKGKWISNLLRGKDGIETTGNYFQVDGAKLGERNPKWLNDDYVKFIRYAQRRIERTGEGVLGFVTNHSYLDNPTFRGMRQSLMETFDDIYLLDLHGDSKKNERPPDGGKDENVFDIQQGVAIALFVKSKCPSEDPARVHHADLFGERETGSGPGKYEWLSSNDIDTTQWVELRPKPPQYLFVPRDETLAQEYEAGWRIPEVFPINSAGIVTARDSLTINWSPATTIARVNDFAGLPSEQARSKYRLGKDVRDWKVEWAQDDINQSGLDDELIAPVLYRPFDTRFTYYTGNSRGFICMPRKDVMRHMLAGENLGLITTRQCHNDWDALVSNTIIAHKALANYDLNSLFPLYTYPTEEQARLGQIKEPNLGRDFMHVMCSQLGLQFVSDGRGDLKQTVGPEDVFSYIYAIFHSPEYRRRYADFLKSDFARIQLTTNLDLFSQLVTLGLRLTSLHLMEHQLSDVPSYPTTGSDTVEKVTYTQTADGQPGRVHINKDQYFEGVDPEVWNCTIGGYKPADKWLKDRKGLTLSYDDIEHYGHICGTLAETLTAMTEIEQTIESHGGWPIT